MSQLLADACLLASLGAAAGLLLAWVALKAFVPLAPPELPRLEAISFGSAAALFGLAAGAVCGSTAGLCAGLVLSRPGGSRATVAWGGGSHSASGERSRRVLAGVQVGLAVASVVGAGLLARTVLTIDRLDPGFSADDMTVFDLRMPYGFGRVPEAYMEALESVVRELETAAWRAGCQADAGASAAAAPRGPAARGGPGRGHGAGKPLRRDRRGSARPLRGPRHPHPLGPRNRRARQPVRRSPVVVVDDVLARALWPGQDPIGERVSGFLSDGTWFTVVGVVSGTRYRELLRQHPRAYYPLRRLGTAPPASLLVRTSAVARGSIDELVRDAFANADPAVRVMNVRNMVEVCARR